MMKHSAVAGLALALVAGSAFAADLPYRKAPIVEPPPPVFTWTGLYGGINIGYGFGNGDQDTGALVNSPYTYTPRINTTANLPTTINPAGTGWWIPNDLSGVLGGGQAGYNYQFNPWLVVGLEADLQATDIHSQGSGIGAGSNGFPLGPQVTYATQNKSVDWFGTVRGRVGVTFPTFPNILVYGTAGLAYGGVVHSVNVSGFYPSLGFGGLAGAVIGAGTNYDQTKVGWTAGGGVEWFPMPAHPLLKAFSVKLEYLYTDLGSTTLYGASIAQVPNYLPGFAYQQTSATRWSTVRLGVNWHFNPFVSAPVLAKY